MPCDAVAVLTLKERTALAMNDLADDIQQVLKQHQLQYVQEKGEETIVFHLDSNPPVSLSITGSTLVAITREGSFEVGRDALEDLLVKMRAEGIALDKLGEVESHVHDAQGNAPQQAYAQQQQTQTQW